MAHADYRADIDGLRALAVLVVVLFHAGQGCKGGFVGVDIFFVISGYLITTQVLRQLQAETFTFGGFWQRRIRRLYPALCVTLGAVGLAGWWLLLPGDAAELGRSLLVQPVLGANFLFWSSSGYFEGAAETRPLLHTWSLAVEEQFYLLYPLLLVWLHRRRSVRFGLAAGAVASLLLACWATNAHPQAAFYLLPTRAWELLLGGLLVFAAPAPGRELLAWTGLAAMLAAALWYSPATPFPGFAALLPCAGAALTLHANNGGTTAVGRLLAWGPMVFIGRISYSWYLWHWPLFAFSRYWALTPLRSHERWGILGVSFLVAVLSWRVVETPVRNRRVLPTGRHLGAAVSASLLFAAALGLGLLWWPRPLPAAAAAYAATQPPAFGPMLELDAARRGELLPLGATRGDLDFVAWGDSHALVLRPVMDELARRMGRRGLAAFHGATLPLLGYVSSDPDALKQDSVPYNQAVLDTIRARRARNVILVARWTNYPRPGLPEALEATVRELRAAGSKVWIVKQVPEHRVNIPRALTRQALFGYPAAQVTATLEQHRARNAWFDSVLAQQRDRAEILDPSALFYPEGQECRIAANGRSLYWDTNHLTPAGGHFLAPLLQSALR